MRIEDIFDPWDLVEEVKAGMVRIQTHPRFPLAIATYTTDCVIAQKWNPVTEQCRGLIWNYETMEVVARPFKKFHNLGHPLAREDYNVEVEQSDKVDGSLGIGYLWEGKCYVATKGSFTSPQADEANRMLHTYYPDWLPPAGVTPLWEIIYPENRIVLDYGDLRLLKYLDGIDINSGKTSSQYNWPGSKNWKYLIKGGLKTVLDSEDRTNAEGWVIRYPDTDERIKIKQKDYLEKHKLVFNLSEKTVWRALSEGKFDEYKAGMPDEFHDWMDQTASPFLAKFEDHIALVNETRFIPEIHDLFKKKDREARKQLAELTRSAPRWVQKCLWCMWDGVSYRSYIYKQFEPKGQTKVAKP